MADNYLDKKMEEYMAKPLSVKKTQMTLKRLLEKNRSHRGYDARFVVREDQLRSIIEVNRFVPSARNQQALRFRPVLQEESAKVLSYIKLGAALPELHLPMAGSEPNAFIVICSDMSDDKYLYIDLGISAQSMLLRATEMGLNGICIGAFDREAVARELSLETTPLLILAIGRGSDKIRLVDIGAGESHSYYREDGVHYVPKLTLDELIIK